MSHAQGERRDDNVTQALRVRPSHHNTSGVMIMSRAQGERCDDNVTQALRVRLSHHNTSGVMIMSHKPRGYARHNIIIRAA
eukprot:992375-Prorocentrum_minimum.AAC.1